MIHGSAMGEGGGGQMSGRPNVLAADVWGGGLPGHLTPLLIGSVGLYRHN